MTTHQQGPSPFVRPPVSDSVRTLGWIAAFLFPLAGFVIGLMCVEKGPKDEGGWMIVLSLFFGAAAYIAFRSAGY